MYCISEQQLDFIRNDIRLRGIEMVSLQQDLLDHVCCIIEQNLEEDGNFESFYLTCIEQFYSQQLIEIEGYERNNIGVMNNTQYQAYNVVSDYIDHAWTVDKTGKINEKRVESAIIGPKARTKSKAWETLMTSMVIQ